MTKKTKLLIGGFFLVIIACLFWLTQLHDKNRADEDYRANTGDHILRNQRDQFIRERTYDRSGLSKTVIGDANQSQRRKSLSELKNLTAQLNNAQTQEEKNGIIQKIAELIGSSRGSKAAATAMAEFIGLGIDAETGLDFVVSEKGGSLKTAPSVRLMVLDAIMESDPEIGLQVSREVMDRLTSADEYAISLKNMVVYDAELINRRESEHRFQTMMAQKDWLENPSAGVYHSFDFAVEFSSKGAFEAISNVLKQDHEKYGNAFRLAADRIMLRNQDVIINKYFENPGGFLKHDGQAEDYTRSVIMSRVDITKPRGLDFLISYLNSFPESNKELDNFIGFYPNANFFLGSRLVSAEENWAVSSIINKDRDVLKIINRLISEDKIPNRYGQEIIQNFERFMSKDRG